ncbi:MAG: NAD-dependent epimerase/dehydratase family protein, partial [Anaerolineales bacterium]|nr:NAD-dependent epimerase/dehydratase family protein [Anaerolineales bacterium]
KLIAEGYRVRALARKTSSLAALKGLPLELVVGDILEPESLTLALQGVAGVFHAAAQSAYLRHPELVLRTSVEGTGNIVQAAVQAGVQFVVLTSSLAAMGVPAPGELLTERHTFNLPQGYFLYGYSKFKSEIEALQIADGRLRMVILNPTVVLGPGDFNQISGSMVVEAARGWGFFWMEGGINIVHIDDVVAGHLAAAEQGRPGERYILGGENLTHRHVFSTLNEITGRKPPWLKIPTWSIRPSARAIGWLRPLISIPFNSDQLRMSRHYLYCDTSKAHDELELPEPLSFRQAAQEAYDWYKEQGMV